MVRQRRKTAPDAVVRRDLPDDRARKTQKREADAPLLGDVDRVVVERVRRVSYTYKRVHEAVARVAERRYTKE